MLYGRDITTACTCCGDACALLYADLLLNEMNKGLDCSLKLDTLGFDIQLLDHAVARRKSLCPRSQNQV